jgi:hypothetical protein
VARRRNSSATGVFEIFAGPAQLNQFKPGIQSEAMRGDLYAFVLNGSITSVWMGTRAASHVPIVLERFGEIY